MPDFDYATPEDVVAELEVGGGTIPASNYAVISQAITRASRLVDQYKKVQPGAYKAEDGTDEIRLFTGQARARQQIDYCVSVTTVEISDDWGQTYSTWTVDTDFVLWPYNALSLGEPYRKLEVLPTKSRGWPAGPRAVRVTALWGVSDGVNEVAAQAVSIQAARWYKRAAQGWQDAGGQAELGIVRYTQRLDPDVKTLLNSLFPHWT